MIICHPYKLIFLKSKKVAGTSFEIALSGACGRDCIITPITSEDELLRRKFSDRGAQNFQHQRWPDGTVTDHAFHNHMTAAEIARNVPKDVWNGYRKIAIRRDPFDVMVSRYHWEGGTDLGLDFEQFVTLYRAFATENEEIAPFAGPYRMDDFVRYSHLEADIQALEIQGLWERFREVRSKSGLRPKSASLKSVYAQYSKTADVIARECADEIECFGDRAPALPVPASEARQSPTRTDFLFAISAGRTGTAWLAKFLQANLGVDAVHEPLGIDQYGSAMPDIGTMRAFNTFGMARRVRDFWAQKLQGLSAPYIETNHTLAKCGLIEAVAQSDLASRAIFVIFRRDLARQVASYISRGDFQNITIDWQWYLSPSYPNVMVQPDALLKLGQIGRALWYALEMETRQAYYLLKYEKHLNFVEFSLEDATTEKGALRMLQQLGYEGSDVTIPPRENASVDNAQVSDEALVTEISVLLQQLEFNPKELARNYIAHGRSLSVPGAPKARSTSLCRSRA